ncbi:MAG TPA: glycoside hydrolase family 127 protein [Bacteroidetes bacterium]|nr:glycoside hydrolase family 127 protein [Bacteroidota bacterium]
MIKIKIVFSLLLVFSLSSCSDSIKEAESCYPFTPVKFTEVSLDDNYWAPRIETNRTVTIPFALQKIEETGRIDNFRKAAGIMDGPYQGKRYNDTDVFKVLEGVAYSLSMHPDDTLEEYADSLIAIIGAAQEDDGYLMTGRTVDPDNPADGLGSERWMHLSGSHELYNSGHLYEAAVAWYEATGKTNFLDIAIKNADLLVETFGPDKKHDAPGHQVIEMGLVKLYRTTGKEEYLRLAEFFLDQRGRPHDSKPYPENTIFALYNDRRHVQDHKPVKEQSEAWGHAVRATYMYAGMADVAAMTGDKEYCEAIDKIWRNVAGKKLYLTGGVGSRSETEAFGADYELPNAEAYNETCAAIGNVFWNHRMFLAHGNAEYIDIIERTMYNGLLSGVSLSGDLFFYPNPLEAYGDYRRSPWFEVSCCPGNIVRFLPSAPGYIYAKKEGDFYVNLYIQSEVNTELGGKKFKLGQVTEYPWSGDVKIAVDPGAKRKFKILLRIPGWVYNKPVPSDLYYYANPGDAEWTLTVNGVPYERIIMNGYVEIEREWKRGDIIELKLPMDIHMVKAHDKVKADSGKLALQRGPIVWCVEEIDNETGVFNFRIPENAGFQFSFSREMTYPTGIITGTVRDNHGRDVSLTAVPYAYRANREAGGMTVWLNETKK